MNQVMLVALGGAIGSVARFKLSGLVLRYSLDWRFPFPTFTVNVLGCLIIGILAGFALKEGFISADMRVLLFTGLMGGFTTFSAFGLETMILLREGRIGIAAAYIVASVVVGLAMMWLGFALVKAAVQA
ncbi:camphor resistance protein CrcB [Methylobacillus rhizosphaerae]|uniref:Fluoride-specific ion channel FluC n=2 Tax=Methylobacillus rhizosphaerae TaxID=551994 RepID=A0A239AUR3_9PROT|nr:camphor resistance protein CrcB [Methylobacillus rhizosphaerae]